jgi:sirohydrochlorin ferrochelatase
MREHRSIVVLLGSRGGARLEPAALASALGVRLLRAELAEGETAVCAALTLAHGVPLARLRAVVGAWAGENGWRATIAPLSGRA